MNITPNLLFNLNAEEIRKILELTRVIIETVYEDLLKKAPLDRKTPAPSAVVFFKMDLEFQSEFDFMEKNQNYLSIYLQYNLGSQDLWKEVVVKIEVQTNMVKKTGPTDSDFESEMEKPLGSANFEIKFYPW